MYHDDFLWRPRRGRHAIILALGLIFSSPLAVFADADAQTLTLPQAAFQALAQNPALQVFTPRLIGLEGKRLTADQNPAFELGFEAENVLGSGELNGLDGAEYTLSLSSVIELGGKRQARTQVASGRYALVEAERRAEALGLLGDVTRGFISALTLQEKLQLADDAVKLEESSHNIVSQRAERGAAPQAEVLRARAQLTQSRLERDRLRAAHDSSLMVLATLLGKETADFTRLQGDLFAFTAADGFPDLFQRARENPDIRVFASQERLREAELALARSQSRSNVRWQVGTRYLEETGDSALVASVSVPLFSGRRNRGEAQAAQAARDEVSLRRESALLVLRSRLYEAYHLHRQAVATVDAMQSRVLPDLSAALDLTRTAYEQGRYSYVEWRTAQRELLAAQRDLVDAATTALLNQALIEQLTGQSLAATESGSGY
ncbi:MAG: TolC family protein [Gammaproteobacteria bacterium]|nr:TolC family protein [Gammaproteobacteria bacterium]